jgi:two-component system, OmpR family, response regulator BaeR
VKASLLVTQPAPPLAPASILIVEDDPKTLDTLALYLRHGGYRVTGARDGREGLRLATEGAFDLVILDRMLPGVDGTEICRRIRASSDVATVMITAMVAESDRLDGFGAGADDYITKPFSPREVLARVNAVLRRSRLQRQRSSGLLRLGDLLVDIEANIARIGPHDLKLSPTEFRLLHVLAGAPTRVFSRDELAERVLRGRGDADLRTVDAHVKNLRRKLDAGRTGESLISTVFGRGYRMSTELLRRA